MEMAEESIRVGASSSGLAVILSNEDGKDNSSKNRIVSYCDDFDDRPVERALEYIFGLSNKSLGSLTAPVNSRLVRSIIKDEFLKFRSSSHTSVSNNRDGICIVDNGLGPQVVGLEESSVCGDIKIVRLPLLVESLAIFSSSRANAFVWKGKWMYEVILETAGVQQLGWATVSCPFNDHKGVGDADDSYAFDGKRVTKWNKEAEPYGQSWVVGDVIGCCIDLDQDEILFYRNGVSLGVAFHGIRKMGPEFGYYPAFSLSQGERCELNFGGRPFKFPIQGFLPLQPPPSTSILATKLLQCLSMHLDMQSVERADNILVRKMRRLKRLALPEQLFYPVCCGICEELFSLIEKDATSTEYLVWGPLVSFMLEVFRVHAPHDYSSLDKFIDVFLQFQESNLMFEHIINALSCGCKTASMVLTEYPSSGSYPYLALACHILRREELMVLWWKLTDFEFLFEGFLSQKFPNKQDLQCVMPSVWWPGSCEDNCYEDGMKLASTALSASVCKIEEKHRELCLMVIQFIPMTTPPQLPGSVFRTFLQNVLLKNRALDRSVPPHGVSSNSVLLSLYTVILHFLSEGFAMKDICSWSESCSTNDNDVGFLHRGGEQSFPMDLFLKNDPNRTEISRLGGSFSHLATCHPVTSKDADVICWEEGFADDEEIRVTHRTAQKPCCCSTNDIELSRLPKHPIKQVGKGLHIHRSSVLKRAAHAASECSVERLNDEITDKHGASDQSESRLGCCPARSMRILPRVGDTSSATLREEELLDTLLFLYHIGVAPNFKQASYYMSQQLQSIALLEETDKQIRVEACNDQLRRLKEARNDYKEEVNDCIRRCAWYRISLLSRWKQRGMYATCMWLVQLLLVLSKDDSLFIYVPEFYLETLVDCFHVLRKSDCPFVPSAIFIKHGLVSFVTFIATHFNDPRILSADLRDLLLQSISVLVQYNEYLTAFENNEAAKRRMPKALLTAFDNRSWIPVSTILLRLCKVSSKYEESSSSSSSSSIVFQKLLQEACIDNTDLFSAFLNRLFNTLSWTMTEFGVTIREMQEMCQVMEFQEKKCRVIYHLSCCLARLLEFCTHEIPQAFLSGSETNLRRLSDLIVFILNSITSTADAEFFYLSLKRHGPSMEKVNHGMILAPLLGIITNLLDASVETECGKKNDVVDVFASMDCPDLLHCGFQYLLEYNWAGSSREDACPGKLEKLEDFLSLLISRIEMQQLERMGVAGETDADETCCICYACKADARFSPCTHTSCYGCIARHLLNCQRCFFCNATILEVIKIGEERT